MANNDLTAPARGVRVCETCSEQHHFNAHCPDCGTRCERGEDCRADHVCARCCR